MSKNVFYSVILNGNTFYLCETTETKKAWIFHKELFNRYYYSEYPDNKNVRDDIEFDILATAGQLYVGGLINGNN